MGRAQRITAAARERIFISFACGNDVEHIAEWLNVDPGVVQKAVRDEINADPRTRPTGPAIVIPIRKAA
jgi:hypothetical protein